MNKESSRTNTSMPQPQTCWRQVKCESRDTIQALARLPMQIRGYGHVKARNLATVRAQWKSLTDTLRTLF